MTLKPFISKKYCNALLCKSICDKDTTNIRCDIETYYLYTSLTMNFNMLLMLGQY